jgi:hypothetical protein
VQLVSPVNRFASRSLVVGIIAAVVIVVRIVGIGVTACLFYQLANII